MLQPRKTLKKREKLLFLQKISIFFAQKRFIGVFTLQKSVTDLHQRLFVEKRAISKFSRNRPI